MGACTYGLYMCCLCVHIYAMDNICVVSSMSGWYTMICICFPVCNVCSVAYLACMCVPMGCTHVSSMIYMIYIYVHIYILFTCDIFASLDVVCMGACGMHVFYICAYIWYKIYIYAKCALHMWEYMFWALCMVQYQIWHICTCLHEFLHVCVFIYIHKYMLVRLRHHGVPGEDWWPPIPETSMLQWQQKCLSWALQSQSPRILMLWLLLSVPWPGFWVWWWAWDVYLFSGGGTWCAACWLLSWVQLGWELFVRALHLLGVDGTQPTAFLAHKLSAANRISKQASGEFGAQSRWFYWRFMRDGRAVTSRFTEVSGDSIPSLFVCRAYHPNQPLTCHSEGKQLGVLMLTGKGRVCVSSFHWCFRLWFVYVVCTLLGEWSPLAHRGSSSPHLIVLASEWSCSLGCCSWSLPG